MTGSPPISMQHLVEFAGLVKRFHLQASIEDWVLFCAVNMKTRQRGSDRKGKAIFNQTFFTCWTCVYSLNGKTSIKQTFYKNDFTRCTGDLAWSLVFPRKLQSYHPFSSLKQVPKMAPQQVCNMLLSPQASLSGPLIMGNKFWKGSMFQQFMQGQTTT